MMKSVDVFVLTLFFGATAIAGDDISTRAVRHETIIDAPIGAVWSAWTTTEGLKSWLAPQADIELKVGGKMRASHQADGTLGDEKTIENTILSFEPQRMLSIKATKPPAGFPYQNAIKDMWTVMYLEPVGADRTGVTITSMGFGQTDEAAKMREFFDKGNAQTLEQLRKKFSKQPGTAETDALKVLQRMVGGEWIFENKKEDGSIFRGRSVIEQGPQGSNLVARGWLGDAAGMFYHSAMQVWRDPESRRVRFQSLDENGALASGEIAGVDENRVSWDWNMSATGNRKARYRVDMIFSDADHYEFILHEVKGDGSTAERVRVKYSRVAQSPEEFHKLKTAKN